VIAAPEGAASTPELPLAVEREVIQIVVLKPFDAQTDWKPSRREVDCEVQLTGSTSERTCRPDSEQFEMLCDDHDALPSSWRVKPKRNAAGQRLSLSSERAGPRCRRRPP